MKEIKKIEEIKSKLSNCAGFFDGISMLCNNPGTINISNMFHSNLEEAFKLLNELHEDIQKKLENKIKE